MAAIENTNADKKAILETTNSVEEYEATKVVQKSIFQSALTLEEAMDADEESINILKRNPSKSKGIHWYYVPAFFLFWVALFFAVVIPVFYHLPQGVRTKSEEENTCTFIAERAQHILIDLERIGPKIVGSYANEYTTVALLLREIEKIRETMDHNNFDLEIDIQRAYGAYLHWHMINMYQGVQNVVVKLSPKNAKSESYFLLNSHFDSKPGSPGTGDDGGMVVIMLEALRVISSSKCGSIEHPLVFLFNGAEENPLQTSHGFITQHKWAKNCKALMNLDCAGSGHREILFQAGPNHPWLMKYYGKHVKQPFATTMAEEVFETGMIPSDTDYRIFKNFGHVPGLDMVHAYNGYVYHTEFDKMDVIPLGTLQATGNHVLALAVAFANAPELEDPSKHATGNTVFFDFLGLFFVYYTETTSQIVNTIVSIASIVLAAISLWRMSVETRIEIKNVLKTFGLIFALHFLGFIMAFAVPALIAVFYDWDDRSMTWFTNKWLVIGQYICPSIFGLTAPTLLFINLRKKHNLPKSFLVQMVLHSQALILALLCIIITFVGIRSSYLFMISLFFYACSLLINLATKLHGRSYYWMITLIISQIMPFLYFSYLIHAMFCITTPMFGRFGYTINPDLLMSALCALGTVLSLGFVMPTLTVFRRSKYVLVALWVITFIFAMISVSHVGFPYRPKTNVGRMNFLHVRRVFYNYEGLVERNESGFYFDFQDRRTYKPLLEHMDLSKIEEIGQDCDEILMCGVPVFNHRWNKARRQAMWLPSEEPIELPGTPTLQLLSKTINSTESTIRFEFNLTAPPHFGIFLNPLKDAKVADWSFLREMLDKPDKYPPPHHIFFSYGIDNSPLNFFFDIKKTDGRFDVPLFELGIAAHFLSYEHSRGPQAEAFLKSFPDYIHSMEWPSSYERYIF